MPFERSSGLLLHIASLPSPGGIGDLGPAAYAFADFLAASKQRLWQVLPLGPTGYGNSPYASLSAFAGNPLLISLELLADRGWIGHDKLAARTGGTGNIDYEEVTAKKLPLIEEAARNFVHRHTEPEWARFSGYCQENGSWLNDWALYTVLRRKYAYASWNQWPEDIKHRTPEAVERIRAEHGEDIGVAQAIQFAFDEQWRSLREYCAARDIRFIGDIAIFVNYDSADVWTHPDLFELNADLSPIRVAGVPPDYFSETGQRWGNPLYKWDALERSGFPWWTDRIRRAHFLYDIIRLDHFRGFEAYWAIPAQDETAVNGQWIKAPGTALFQTLRERARRAALHCGRSRPDHQRSRRAARAVRFPRHESPAVRILRPRRPHPPAAPIRNQHGGVYRDARQRHNAGLVENVPAKRTEPPSGPMSRLKATASCGRSSARWQRRLRTPA